MSDASFGEKIKLLRNEQKMNQKAFAEAIGIKQSTLSSYENGVVTPSNEVLLSIAQRFHVSLDWLFGLSDKRIQLSTLSDVVSLFLQMNETNELRYELEINNNLPDDQESEVNRWSAAIRFYGNDKKHSLNADMCNFLADLMENREGLESYFTGKDMYEMWKKQTIDYYKVMPITDRPIEDLDFSERIKRRDQLLADKYKKNED